MRTDPLVQPITRRVLLPFAAAIGFAATAPELAAQRDPLDVLRDESNARLMMYSDAPNAFYHHLRDQVHRHLDTRRAAIAALRTREDWRARQQEVRAELARAVGPFPERTPLNARVAGTLRRGGFRVEKILFESQPGYPVPAALFLPDDLEEPRPAVLYLSGHTADGFRDPAYQTAILNLVRKGFVVFAIDPIGQGERTRYPDPQGGSLLGAPTREHMYPGAQLFLAGGSLAREMIWDAMRALDYLETRPEVDRTRIGATGRSGGGTQTAQLAALDDRVQAAVIANYIVGFGPLWDTRGPQDVEQDIPGWISVGLDHADLLQVRAPKPALVIATTRDYFTISGVRETVREVARTYDAFGAAERLGLVEADTTHASTRPMREAMYAFFQRWLDLPGDSVEADVEPFDPRELHVTGEGGLAHQTGWKWIFDLASDAASARGAELARARVSLTDHLPRVSEAARRISGFVMPDRSTDPRFMGRHRRDGYSIEEYIVHGEGGYPLPILLWRPDGAGPHPVALYLHPGGKAALGSAEGEAARLLAAGYAVLAPDLPGIGELGNRDYQYESYRFGPRGEGRYGTWMGSILIGRSITGILASDVIRLAHAIDGLENLRAGETVGIARGELAPVLLHAAAFSRAFDRVALLQPMLSWEALATTESYPPPDMVYAVPLALEGYDLPDLAATLAPTPLLLLNSRSGSGEAAPGGTVEAAWTVTRDAYRHAGAAPGLTLVAGSSEGGIDRLLSWLRR